MSWLSNLNRNSGGQSENRRQGDPNLRIGLSAVVSVYMPAGSTPLCQSVPI